MYVDHPIERVNLDSETHLKKIAQLLGCPIKEFFETDRGDSADLEFFRFLSSIRSKEDRVLALEYLKAIVARQDLRSRL